MKRFLAAAAVAAFGTAFATADIIISEVVDGDLSGGNPKYVELTNTGNADYTFPTGGGIILQSNASTDLDLDVDLTGETIGAGESYVIQSTANGGQAVFESTYGLVIGVDIPGLYTPAFFSNGDDRYIVTDGTNLIDIHGEIDVDGTGTPWEYLDSYAYRNPTSITSNGGVFVLSDWTHAGVSALDTLDAAAHAALTTPGTHVFVPEPASLGLLALGLLGLRRR